MRSTHTYVTLPVSAAAHKEIKQKLLAAGYDHAIDGDEINMHGLALIPEVEQTEPGKAPANEGDHG